MEIRVFPKFMRLHDNEDVLVAAVAVIVIVLVAVIIKKESNAKVEFLNKISLLHPYF